MYFQLLIQMKRMLAMVSVFSSGLILAGCMATPPELTHKQMYEDYDYMVDIVKNVYPGAPVAQNVYGIDFDEKFSKYREGIVDCKDAFDFHLLVADALGACKGNHLWPNGILFSYRFRFLFWTWYPSELFISNEITNEAVDISYYYTRNQLRKLSEYQASIPLFYYDGKYYTKYAFQVKGQQYEPGMELVAINNIPYWDILLSLQDKLESYDPVKNVFFGSQLYANIGENFYVLMMPGETKNFLFKKADGEMIYIAVELPQDVVSLKPQRAIVNSNDAPEATYIDDLEILYFRIPAMNYSYIDIYRDAIEKSSGLPIRAIIFDIRHNLGGYDKLWMEVISHLTDKTYESKHKIAFMNTELSRKYLKARVGADEKYFQAFLASSEISPVPFLGEQSYIQATLPWNQKTAKNSLNLDVPVYVLAHDIYSSSGVLSAVAEQTDSITTIGERNMTSLGCGITPHFVVLPNSKIIFSLAPGIDISNCKSSVDVLHLEMEDEISLTLQDKIEYFNAETKDLGVEERLKNDPYFQKALELLNDSGK